MAGILLQSRYAGLKIDDDMGSLDAASSSKKKAAKKAKQAANKASQQQAQQQPQQQQPSSKKKKKKTSPTGLRPPTPVNQEEEEEDAELAQVLLESKMEYEKKLSERNGNRPNKKNKKCMTLDEFNQSFERDSPVVNDVEPTENIKPKVVKPITPAPKEVVHRPQITNGEILGYQWKDELTKRDETIVSLEERLEQLQNQFDTLKSRHIMLCNVLSQAEMKLKADIIIELERVRALNAEMTTELIYLRSELEKERSKNPDSKNRKKKSKEKSAN